MRTAAIFLVIGFCTLISQADPRMWEEAGIPIRQGYHIPWTPVAVTDDAGYTIVVWSDMRTGDRNIYAQLYNPAGEAQWAAGGVVVSSGPKSQRDPAVCPVIGGWIIAWIDDRNDTVLIEGEGGDVWAQKLNSNGQRLWSANDFSGICVAQSLSSLQDQSVHATSCGDGAIIAWINDNIVRSQRVDGSGNLLWTQPLILSSTVCDWCGLVASSDSSGNMFLAWTDRLIPDSYLIYAAKITPEGQLPWGQGNIRLSTTSNRQSDMSMCSDGSNGCYISWVVAGSGTIGRPDIYVQHLNADGQPQWAANGISPCDTLHSQSTARVALSLNGNTPDGCLLVWEDKRLGNIVNEVYAQKVNLNGTVAWGSNGLIICGGTEITHENPNLTSDRNGGMVCIWEDTRNSESDWGGCDLYAARVLANGTLGWNGACGVEVASGPGQQLQPVIGLASGSPITVVYTDSRQGSPMQCIQHLNLESGSRLLDPLGVQVIAGIGQDAHEPQTLSLGQGRVAIVWQDQRYVRGGRGLFYQIIGSDGQIQRTLNGDTLAPDNEGWPEYRQEDHRLCPDGNGGFFVSFADVRSGTRQIRLSHVDASGNITGSRAGTVLRNSDAGYDQIEAFCAADGQNGCYVALGAFNAFWNLDVYVTLRDAAGAPVWNQSLRLTTSDDDDRPCGMVVGEEGCAYVIYRGGIQGQHDIFLAKVCRDGYLSWSMSVCDAPNDQDNPQVVGDGDNGVYMVWEDNRNGTSTDQQIDIYAQHINGNSAPLWTNNGIPIVSLPLYQGSPKIAADAAGNLCVAWPDFRSGSHFDLYAQKVSPDGQTLWTENGIAVSDSISDIGITLDATSSSGIFISWISQRLSQDAGYHAYATELSADGTPVADPYWIPGRGGLISNSIDQQRHLTVASDGAGGFIAAWENRIIEPPYEEWVDNIYAQRIAGYLHSEEPETALPSSFSLAQNYPNPFNPVTEIAFDLPQTGRANLRVFDVTGREVAVLADGVMTTGAHTVTFDAHGLPSGIYFYRLQSGKFSECRKMILLR